jgi:zinc transporter 13
MTASIGMTGACFALWMDAVDAKEANSLWVLPFSAGGFLNIALVSVLPDILKEKEPKEALIQLVFMLLGISTMAVLCIV